jgi:UDP-N-acetylmuramoylalanine--D-glutamate ligase
MNENSNIFLNKKILVYGLGKSGISTFNFLKNKNDISLFDDFKNKIASHSLKNKILPLKKVLNSNFDLIILSPGIDLNNCKLSRFLKRNLQIIYTDLDIFYSFYKNDCITITGTNGKSTTCKLLYEVLKKHKLDVKLSGNIGYPILSTKKILPRTIFIVEASSYQLDYSKIFNSKYAAILNISPDHLERHKTLKKYISAKFKLLSNQIKGSIAFINNNDLFIKNKIKNKNYKSKIIKVDIKLKNKFLNNIQNDYFLSSSNKENLSFVLEIAKYFKVKKKYIIDTLKNFKGLKYRQQIIYKSKNISIINDSKSTSYSSSIEMLKSYQPTYWLLGGIPKKGDKLTLPKKFYKNIKAFIYGKNNQKFSADLKNKIRFEKFLNLSKALDAVFLDIKKNNIDKKIVLFSPSAASFDNFKNFEERGLYFNKIIKKYLNEK